MMDVTQPAKPLIGKPNNFLLGQRILQRSFVPFKGQDHGLINYKDSEPYLSSLPEFDSISTL